MKHLFSPEGGRALAATMALNPLLAFDFDGTLSPIVVRPEEARVSMAVARRLEALAQRLPVAIVSGRSLEDLRARLSFEPTYLVGNHGAEDPQAPLAPALAQALDCSRAQLEGRRAELEAAGVQVEDKGLSLALHYRQARDPALALGLIRSLTAGFGPGVTAYGGKRVVNVVPAGAPDKADALLRLVARSGAKAAVFAGDDVNDEPVFVRAAPEWLTVRVGRNVPGTQASFCLDDSSEVALLLGRMLALLDAGPAALSGTRSR